MVTNVPIDGSTLRWAREAIFIDRAELARAAGTKPEKIAEFEEGGKPTFRQLTLIAKKLDRPLGFFFAPPPEQPDVPAAVDFRGGATDEIPPTLAREMRRTEQYRATVIDLDGTPSPAGLGEPFDWTNVANRAAELRTSLGVTDAFVPPESDRNQVFNFWRGLLEERGILVFQSTRIPLSAFRGLSIYHDALPIILINGADAANGKVFTLFHEIAHLMNRTSGLCVLHDHMPTEALANAFAANFLMPLAQVTRSIADEPSRDARALVEHVSRQFKVSVVAAAVRLKAMDILNDAQLQDIWAESDEAWDKHRAAQKSQEGGPQQWRVRFRDLGPAYIGTIVRAIDDGRVDWLDATYLLNARLMMAEQIVDEYRRSEGRR